MFAGSIADNIGFFDPAATSLRIEAAARNAAVHEEIVAMPMGYESVVGDMGSALSGGQKQRVILARALYGRPHVKNREMGRDIGKTSIVRPLSTAVRRCGLGAQLRDGRKLAFSAALMLLAVTAVKRMGVGPATAAGSLCGTLGGIGGHWWATQLAEVDISIRLVPVAEAWFEGRHYVHCFERNELVPDFPRFLRFDAQNVRFVALPGGSMTFIGPWYLRRQFAKAFGLT